MKKIIKTTIISMLFASIMIVGNANQAQAITGVFKYEGSDTNTKYGTKGTLKVKTTLYLDTPIFTTCDVKSKGSSNTSFKKNGVKCTRTFKAHTINAKISGIGFSSISSDSGLEMASESRSATYSVDTYNWDYTICSDIWRLFNYQEVHSVSYKLKVPSKTATTITMSKKIKY